MSSAPLTSRPARWTFLLAAVATFLAVAMGSVVCATDSSAACPHWPGCYVGGVLPEGEVNPLVEMVHRAAAASTAPLILASAVLGARRGRGVLVRIVPWASLACALAAGVFGMMIILFTLPLPLAVLDLLCSLAALVGTTASAAAAWRGAGGGGGRPDARLAYGIVAGLLLLHALGVIAAGRGSLTRCVGWPVLARVEADDASLQWLRWVLAAALVAAMTWLAARTRATRPGLAPLAVAPLVLVALEVTLGLTVLQAHDLVSKTLYSVVAVLVLAAASLTAAWLLTAPGGSERAARRTGSVSRCSGTGPTG